LPVPGGVDLLDGVDVSGDEGGQGFGVVLGVADGLGGGDLGAFGGEDGVQDLEGGAGVGVAAGSVHPFVVVQREDLVGGDVERGGVLGSGERDVQVLALHSGADQGVSGVDGGALGAVHGAGVEQFVIVNWNLELQRAIRRLYTDPDPTQAEPPRLDSEAPDRPGEPDIVYLTRLAGTITVTSTAIETGRHLLADDLRADLALNRANGTARTEHPAGANGVAINGAALTANAQSPAGQLAQQPTALDSNLRPPAPVHSAQPGPTLRSDR
jgi:hypothetical protein